VDSATISKHASTPPGESPPDPILASWLGRVPYREAWDLQRRLVAARADGTIGDRLLLLEHPAVLTLGKHADEAHVLASPDELARRGIEVLRVERGGEVTYHGPGQLVAYPILGLSRRGLLVRPLVRALEAAMVATCSVSGVRAARREGHPGCWCDPDGATPRKIGALGLRVERGVSFHGIALNVAPDLDDFDLIDPCGMPGVTSTSIAREAGRRDEAPSTAAVEDAAWIFANALAAELGARVDVGDGGVAGATAASAAAAIR
jgi:lipoate-protein ligase B